MDRIHIFNDQNHQYIRKLKRVHKDCNTTCLFRRPLKMLTIILYNWRNNRLRNKILLMTNLKYLRPKYLSRNKFKIIIYSKYNQFVINSKYLREKLYVNRMFKMLKIIQKLNKRASKFKYYSTFKIIQF